MMRAVIQTAVLLAALGFSGGVACAGDLSFSPVSETARHELSSFGFQSMSGVARPDLNGDGKPDYVVRIGEGCQGGCEAAAIIDHGEWKQLALDGIVDSISVYADRYNGYSQIAAGQNLWLWSGAHYVPFPQDGSDSPSFERSMLGYELPVAYQKTPSYILALMRRGGSFFPDWSPTTPANPVTARLALRTKGPELLFVVHQNEMYCGMYGCLMSGLEWADGIDNGAAQQLAPMFRFSGYGFARMQVLDMTRYGYHDIRVFDRFGAKTYGFDGKAYALVERAYGVAPNTAETGIKEVGSRAFVDYGDGQGGVDNEAGVSAALGAVNKARFLSVMATLETGGDAGFVGPNDGAFGEYVLSLSDLTTAKFVDGYYGFRHAFTGPEFALQDSIEGMRWAGSIRSLRAIREDAALQYEVASRRYDVLVGDLEAIDVEFAQRDDHGSAIGTTTRLGFSGSAAWFIAMAHFIGAGATLEFEHEGTIGGEVPRDLVFLYRCGERAELYASYFADGAS